MPTPDRDDHPVLPHCGFETLPAHKPARHTPPSLAAPASVLLRLIGDEADRQRATAQRLRDLVTVAHDNGATWSDIGRALGMVRETAFRQHKAGSPIVVVQPHQRPR